MTSENDLISRDEVRKMLKVSLATMSRFIKTGKLTYYQIGRRKLFNRDEVLAESRQPKNA